MIKVAIFGYGTVGSGVYEVLNKNSETIQKKIGNEIEVKYMIYIVTLRFGCNEVWQCGKRHRQS